MARGLREHGMFRFSWFIGKRNWQFLAFFFCVGPLSMAHVYFYKNWDRKGLKDMWYSTLNNRLDEGYRMRHFQGLEDPDGLRARLNKLQAPEEYAPHLPADDFVAHNEAYRKN